MHHIQCSQGMHVCVFVSVSLCMCVCGVVFGTFAPLAAWTRVEFLMSR